MLEKLKMLIFVEWKGRWRPAIAVTGDTWGQCWTTELAARSCGVGATTVDGQGRHYVSGLALDVRWQSQLNGWHENGVSGGVGVIQKSKGPVPNPHPSTDERTYERGWSVSSQLAAGKCLQTKISRSMDGEDVTIANLLVS